MQRNVILREQNHLEIFLILLLFLQGTAVTYALCLHAALIVEVKYKLRAKPTH